MVFESSDNKIKDMNIWESGQKALKIQTLKYTHPNTQTL